MDSRTKGVLWALLGFVLALIVNQTGFGQALIHPAQRVPYLFIEVLIALTLGMVVYAISEISAICHRIAEMETEDALAKAEEAAAEIVSVNHQLSVVAEDLLDLHTRLNAVPTTDQLAALEERINVLSRERS